MAKKWTAQEILDFTRTFQPVCVMTAAAALDVFSPLHAKPMKAETLADELDTDLRATTILLDALVALEFLSKQGEIYSVPENIAGPMTEQSDNNVLPMVRHLANCLRRWAELAEVTRTGKCTETGPSVRGADADRADFIGAMNLISEPIAAGVIDKIQPSKFHYMLDIGGGPGTWSMAFLNAAPKARAMLFDLPAVVSIAKKNFAEAGLTDRVTLVEGDFYNDALPEGADLAWLGAICHQNSRQQNRDLFSKVYAALADGGVAVIRDVIMDSSRTSPVGGALFAVNMLTATESGGTYTFDEYCEDLCSAGFAKAELVYRDELMSSLIQARKV